MNVLQLTVHFRPNLGGVETHLDDLCKALVKRGHNVTVLTYRPLHTKVKWKIYEKVKNLGILRIPWLPNLFYKLVSFPLLEFVYLSPGLFILTPFVLMMSDPDIIHAHGLVAGFVGVFWGKIFGKRIIVSTHSIYNFPKKGIYRNFTRWIFSRADIVLGLSKQSAAEIKSLGVLTRKVDDFTYWIDLKNFKKIPNAKKMVGKKGKFVVLFVGRLVQEKGILQLLAAAKSWERNITLIIIGSGPLEKQVRISVSRLKNVEYIGLLNQNQLPIYYSGSDLLIFPSDSEEGFGRVILEGLACGLPVIAANRGAIPEVIDQSVGRLIDVKEENIKQAVEHFYYYRNELKKLAKNCRKFAERRFSTKNVKTIIRAYKK